MRPNKTALLLALALSGACLGALRYRGAGADISESAEKFLASLTSNQRELASMAFDDPLRRDWHFIPKPTRKGLQIKYMNADQREQARNLLRACLSQTGFEKSELIMSLETILRELEKARVDGPLRDPERYYFTIFGQPGSSGKWGLSIEGHHLSLNFVIEDGKLVATTPTFFGANPGVVKGDIEGAPKTGTRALAKEEDLAFELLHSLTAEQRQTALIDAKAPMDLRAAGEPQAPDTAAVGLAAKELTEGQSKTLWALLEVYANNMPAEIGAARLAAIKEAGAEKVHFAWAGADQPGIGHYYRLQGPTFVVELVNTQPDAQGNVANHIHSVWRDMAGDFGVPR